MSTVRPNKDIQPDDSLWNRFKEGDSKAFEQIYNLYVDDLYRFGKSITARHALTKDCIQDVFVDLWHYREHVARDVRVKFYLMRMLANKIQRQIGEEAKGKNHERNDFFCKETSQSSCEDEFIKIQEIDTSHQKLNRALSNLPVRQREVIHYVFYENMSYEEVAKLMGIHIRSAYTLAWKAIGTLKNNFVWIAIILFFWLII